MKQNTNNDTQEKKQKSKYDLKQILKSKTKSGVDIKEILDEENLTIRELLLLKLLIAEEAYLSAEKKIGDQLILEVEQFHPKGEDVVKLLEIVKKNKKLYFQKSKSERKYVFVKNKK